MVVGKSRVIRCHDAYQIAAGNAGWRFQFRFAVHAGWSRVPEHKTLGITEPMKKSITIGIGVALLIVVSVMFWHHEQSLRDAEIHQKLAGDWVSENPAIKGTITFRSDGNFAVNETFGLGTNAHPVKFDGTWQVKDGYLTTTPTQAVLGEAHLVGSRAKIIRVNDRELVLIENGHTITRNRSQ